jgi:NADH-quinone oxidoreductase subunit K
MNVPLSHVLILGAALFALGAVCAITRRSMVLVLVGLEFMLTAACIVFVGAALAHGNLDGQAAVIIVMGLAAAEAALGLALLIHIRRGGGSVNPDAAARLEDRP